MVPLDRSSHASVGRLRSAKKRWWEKTVNALCPIDASGGNVFAEGECLSATSDTFVSKGEPVQTIAVKGLTTKVKAET
jgi:membrane-bound ClpP family serine protease